MAHGKSIRLYLADGSPSGIRHAEIVNWTGQAIAAPRTRYPELKSWLEVARPGVYLLIGVADDASEFRVYVGESENVFDRLADHLRYKDFWNDCVIFTSKDENLTKSHIRYLESRLVWLAEKAGRCVLDNADHPDLPALPRADKDSMDEFISFIQITLGALGYPITESIPASPEPAVGDSETTRGREFTFSGHSFSARGTQTDDGFVVFADSLVATEAAATTPTHVKSLRDTAVAEKKLVLDGETYRLTSDYLLNSPSAAAAFVAGSSRNGRDLWTDKFGRTLKTIEEAAATNATAEQ